MNRYLRPLSLTLTAALLVTGGCDKKKRGSDDHGDKSAVKDQEKAKAEGDEGSKEKEEKKAAAGEKAAKPGEVAAKSTDSAASGANPADASTAKIAYEAPFDGPWEERHEFRNGLVMEDFVIGTGEPAVAGSRAQIHYTGYLLDGTVFDSSVKNGRKPFDLTLGQGRVIQGWDKGIVGMRTGGKRRLIIPADLAYGSAQRGKIPANSTLIFTLEMISLKAPYGEPKSDEVFKGKPVAKQKLEGGKLEIYDYVIGTGDAAQSGDTVAVHYTGSLDNGTVFDSSVPRKSPIEFPLGRGRVIKGWDLGIAGMQVGGQRKLVIDSELGYGDRDMGKIPPKSKLTFTVELMGIDRPAAAAPVESAKTESKGEESKGDASSATDKTPAKTESKTEEVKPAKTTKPKPASAKGSEKPSEAPQVRENEKPAEGAQEKTAEAPAEKQPQ
jgi:peptidylprolyl isomerase